MVYKYVSEGNCSSALVGAILGILPAKQNGTFSRRKSGRATWATSQTTDQLLY